MVYSPDQRNRSRQAWVEDLAARKGLRMIREAEAQARIDKANAEHEARVAKEKLRERMFDEILVAVHKFVTGQSSLTIQNPYGEHLEERQVWMEHNDAAYVHGKDRGASSTEA